MLLFVIIFLILIGLVYIFLPLGILSFFQKKYDLPAKIFWKSGLMGLIVGVIYIGIMVNIGDAIPGFKDIPSLAQLIIFGCLSGLFVELGQFVVLDRMLPSVRSRESAVLFGVGWASIVTIVTGFVFILGAFGIYKLMNVHDVSHAFPQADTEQIATIVKAQEMVQKLVDEAPFNLFAPMLDNLTTMVMDVALCLLIVLGLKKQQSRFTWFTVGLKSFFSSLLLISIQYKYVPFQATYLFIMAACGILGFFIYKKGFGVKDRDTEKK